MLRKVIQQLVGIDANAVRGLSAKWEREAVNLRRMTPRDGARWDRSVKADMLLRLAGELNQAINPKH